MKNASYKAKETAHYDALAKAWQRDSQKSKWSRDAEYLEHGIFSSYAFCDDWLTKYIKKGHTLLDYGCGNGIHSVLPAKLGAHVTGIDLSQESLKIARLRAKKEGVEKNTRFTAMDAEHMEFATNSFDYIFDGGTFSSLNLQKAIPELARVLKPEGALIAIETLGHNPLTNLKRRLNKSRGARTSWAVDHILRMTDIDRFRIHFEKVDTHFFHLLSLVAFPFLSVPGGKALLHTLEIIDSLLLKIPFLQRYAFKVVIVASEPKNSL
jgi:SAM-dependent methyltransferase